MPTLPLDGRFDLMVLLDRENDESRNQVPSRFTG